MICDKAFHKRCLVRDYLEQWKDQIVLPPIQADGLPCDAPETNPNERNWWRMHETITRNHRCPTLTNLVDQAYQWFEQQRGFVYRG